MRTEPGLVLEGRYELTSLIATGGMGQVWKGLDRELDREVAVKVLREEYAGDEGFLKRFRAEARHTAALSHDAIAALYDYGELDGRAYIVMELCPGRPLSDIIEENTGGLPEKRVVSVLIDLARALDAAHSKGVVHRDVKPENVLVDETRDWAVKITDFGIARSKDQARLTKTGLVMGTAQYLSPEQAMGKQATSLSDIYALGIVAYEMLVGHRPFTGSSQVEIAMAQVKQQPKELPDTVGADLRKLVMMSLAKAPANRPRSAAAVARILEAIQRGVEPRFTTGAIPVTRVEDHDWTGENALQRRDGEGSGGASGGPTRTAAMPLPMSGRGRGIRHRSGPSARSAPSGLSASSAGGAPRARPAGPVSSARSAASPSPVPSEPRPAADPALRGADRAFTAGSFDTVDTAASGRTARGTSTGRRLGPFSVPGLVLLVLLVVVILGAVAAGLGLLPLGELGAAGSGALDGVGQGTSGQLSASTMVGSAVEDHGTRSGVL
ncbi:serine/threonine-protein kinase [Brachybacterium sp. J153]|uniref:serine/threonine-protein kinase n=1 Tax=Brachybacterium sp. J153 TaxID=3116488 RepID=UPI002E77D383|nr:serine/threonine-protein kinase [Brachybacterium sp. J153]MEE1617932.1 serine/threonine-protein kinase [Brachybacterium sp. J153]